MLTSLLTVFLITHSVASLTGAADGYTLWLSDTSLTMQPDGGPRVGMRFPPGNCKRWHCTGVFAGVDLAVYRQGTGFEYDWVVSAGADPSIIHVSFTGAAGERIAANGDLILDTAGGEVRHQRPFAYQEINGVRHPVPVRFHLTDKGGAGFILGTWDRQHSLVIDPALSFVSGVGAAASSTENAAGVALDGSGNIFLTGTTISGGFPLVNGLPLPGCAKTGCLCPAVFAAKISPDGKTLLYSTLLTSGSNSAVCLSETPPAIAVDSAGNAYIIGDLPAQNSLVRAGGGTATANGPSDGFIVKLDPNGSLLTSITLGGSGADAGTSITLGTDGKLYIVGTTGSADFPVSSSAFHKTISSSQDVFLMRIDPASLAVTYSTFLAQGSSPVVSADAQGNAYVAASTTSATWPVTAGVFQPQCAGRIQCADVVVAKMNPAGSQLLYATYFGGSGTETIGGIALDSSGGVYLTGTTNSSDFPSTSTAFVRAFDPLSDRNTQTAFAVNLNAAGTAVGYATLLNSDGGLTGNAIAVDSAGNAYVAGAAVGMGTTAAGLLPVMNAIQQSLVPFVCFNYTASGVPVNEYYCPRAGYLAALNGTGTSMLWATYLGGGAANALVVDRAGNATVAGFAIAMRKTAASPAPGNSASAVKIALNGTSLSNIFVQNAAQFQVGLPASGGLAALYISGVGAVGSSAASGLPLPPQLGGFTIQVDDIPAPLLAVAGLSSGNEAQLNFQVPFEVTPDMSPQPRMMEVDFNGQSAFIAPEQTPPGIFTLNTGVAAIQHASDYSLQTLQNPVHPGEAVIAYATGLGPVTTPVPAGSGSPSPDPVDQTCNSISTNAGTILYAGLTPGVPGLYQVDIQLSPNLAPGVDYIYLQANACWLGPPPFYQSPGVALYVSP
jgi:uncharacterized protein (TIGR03437 family)